MGRRVRDERRRGDRGVERRRGEETEVNSRDVETYYLRGWVKGTSKKVMLIIMNDITSYKINIYIYMQWSSIKT